MSWKIYKHIYLIQRIIRFFIWKIKYRLKYYKIKPFVLSGFAINIDSSSIKKELNNLGIEILPFILKKSELSHYYETARYSSILYKKFYKEFYINKIIEHFVSFKILEFRKEDVYLDAGSSFSEFTEIVKRLVGCKVYRQDLDYPKGVCMDMIGGNAAKVPLPDNSITKITLHNTFEHFEMMSDINFMHEINRLLKNKGMACIIPLDLANEYYNLIDFTMTKERIAFDKEAKIIYTPGCGSRFERWYSVKFFKDRIIDNLSDLKIKIYSLENPEHINYHQKLLNFMLILEKLD